MPTAFVTEGAKYIRVTGFKSALSRQADVGAKNNNNKVDTMYVHQAVWTDKKKTTKKQYILFRESTVLSF